MSFLYYSLIIYYLFLRMGISLPLLALNVPRLTLLGACKSSHSVCSFLVSVFPGACVSLTWPCSPQPPLTIFSIDPFFQCVWVILWGHFLFSFYKFCIDLHYWDICVELDSLYSEISIPCGFWKRFKQLFFNEKSWTWKIMHKHPCTYHPPLIHFTLLNFTLFASSIFL